MSAEMKLALALAGATFLLNVLAQVAKRAGWTRIQWFIEAMMPLAIDAAGRAAAAPKNAKQVDDLAKVIAIAQKSDAVQLHVSTPPPLVDPGAAAALTRALVAASEATPITPRIPDLETDPHPPEAT